MDGGFRLQSVRYVRSQAHDAETVERDSQPRSSFYILTFAKHQSTNNTGIDNDDEAHIGVIHESMSMVHVGRA